MPRRYQPSNFRRFRRAAANHLASTLAIASTVIVVAPLVAIFAIDGGRRVKGLLDSEELALARPEFRPV